MFLSAQEPVPPPVTNNFSRLTTSDEIAGYIQQLESRQHLMKSRIIGKSVKGKNLHALFFSTSEFGKDTSRIKVLIFAQQHGNEQSGKEGALLLIRELLKPENHYLFSKIDLVLVPQVNPDGSEVNRRRNASATDLNRNHLILTEPETRAVHQLFDQYLFEVTLDVHEYSPYSDEWKKFGYRKNTEVTLGATTNLNVSGDIRRFSDNGFLPFIFRYLNDHQFSCLTYCPGGPPNVNYIRHSTFDINDGRQSFGIQNTFSFIQEGMNGEDDSIQNLQRRAEGQMTGMMGLLNYVYTAGGKIKKIVRRERGKLLSGNDASLVSIQSEHISSGKKLDLPLFSYKTGNDTLYQVKDYRPAVKSTYDVQKPSGYLIPVSCIPLTEWVNRHGFTQRPVSNLTEYQFWKYDILDIGKIDFEGDTVVNPVVRPVLLEQLPADQSYIYLPCDQLKGNILILALEPKSMLGLVTYQSFSHLLKKGEAFPVLRVVKK